MKLNRSEISEIIEMAWDDKTSFGCIAKIYNIGEDQVKKIMKKNIKRRSYDIWRNRISKRSIQKTQLKGKINA